MFNNNNIVINNNYGRLIDLSLLIKIPMGTQSISSELLENLGTRPQNVSPALV